LSIFISIPEFHGLSHYISQSIEYVGWCRSTCFM